MNALQHKLIRTIQTTLGQFIALVMVALGGVTVYYGTGTALSHLISSQQAFYRETAFADYYFEVDRAPAGVVKRIREVPGVLAATGRVQKDVKILKNGSARDTGRLTGFGTVDEPQVNRLFLVKGRYFDQDPSAGGNDVLIDRQYAAAKGIKPGDSLDIIIDGKKGSLRVAGMATSPEFLYKTRNALEFPDIDGMAIIMMPELQAQQILKMTGEINQVLVKFSPGAKETQVKELIEKILKPYGVVTSYPRRDQLSHKYIQSQIDSLSLAAKLLPPGFFVVTIAVQFVLLRRLIKAQHLQIGVMKALGYENRSIMLLFTAYSLTITTAGTILGLLAGSGLAGLVSNLLEQIMELPKSSGGINWLVLLNNTMINAGVGLFSGLLASWEVTRINPAEAFHRELPAAYEKTFLEEWRRLWAVIHSSWKMSLRSISRNLVRFIATTMGITATMAMILVALYFTNSRDYLLYRYFNIENRYDYTVRFNNPIKENALGSWNGWPEIQKLGSVLEIPVTMSNPGAEGSSINSKEDIIIGLEPEDMLREIFDSQYKRLFVPEDGILINQVVADKLGLKVGELVEVETKPGMGPLRRVRLLVRGIDRQNIGGNSFVSLEQANRILGENDVINAAMVKSDSLKFNSLENRFAQIPGVASVLSQEKQKQNAVRLMVALTYFTTIMIIAAMVIGASIVYNNSVMCFNERKRELASLRVIGWSEEDIAGLLFNEIILALLLGIAIGLPLGKHMGGLYLQAISTETFVWPVVLYPSTSVISAVSTTIFALAGHLLAMRKVKELDLVEVLKDRD